MGESLVENGVEIMYSKDSQGEIKMGWEQVVFWRWIRSVIREDTAADPCV